MKFDVHNRITGEVQFTADIDASEDDKRSVKLGLAIRWAVKAGAYLIGANLIGANLRSADLTGANLRGADLIGADLMGAGLEGVNGVNDWVRSIHLETYPITYTSDTIQIGCEQHAISEWRAFDDARIVKMDGIRALKFWRKYKSWIFQTIELCPAMPTMEDTV